MWFHFENKICPSKPLRKMEVWLIFQRKPWRNSNPFYYPRMAGWRFCAVPQVDKCCQREAPAICSDITGKLINSKTEAGWSWVMGEAESGFILHYKNREDHLYRWCLTLKLNDVISKCWKCGSAGWLNSAEISRGCRKHIVPSRLNLKGKKAGHFFYLRVSSPRLKYKEKHTWSVRVLLSSKEVLWRSTDNIQTQGGEEEKHQNALRKQYPAHLCQSLLTVTGLSFLLFAIPSRALSCQETQATLWLPRLGRTEARESYSMTDAGLW